MIEQSSASLGRFDKSFLIHMIRDFFLVLVLVTVLEFALKASLVYWNYATDGGREAQTVAEDLAENVRSIMRNEGGPVAARTMYPILEKNWSDLGYTVAVVPSDVTIRSIEEGFDYTPRGIPAEDWPEGSFKVATLEIEAEAYCLACHSEANVGDVLGTVTVRNYLSRDFALWFEDVKLTAGLAVGKILLHSVLLFLILRARMEPLLRLRSVVSNLARAYGGLNHRAEIRTADEFGMLARDLNLFLDRISRLIGELDQVLSRVVAVNDDIVTIQGDLRGQIDTVVSGMRQLERDAMLSAKREPRLSNEWFVAIRNSIAALDETLAKVGEMPEAASLVENLRDVVANAETQIATSERVFEGLAALGDDTEQLKGAMSEMTRLEERMKAIVETGGVLVRRLRPDATERPAPAAAGE
ncbi:MAG: methyl-accepting chemotaxis protein [Pseudomonadota bacterium]